MGDSFATPSDVAAAWRPLTDLEEITVATQLAYASAIIRTNVPDIDDRLAAGKVDPTLVRGITVEMVLRQARNPTGVTSTSESLEDYQYSEAYSEEVATGSIFLADAELALLQRPRRRRRGAFSIAPGIDPPTCAAYAQVAAARARHERGWP